MNVCLPEGEDLYQLEESIVNHQKFCIGTFNVRGLNDKQKRAHLSNDIDNYKVDICCLQETKITEDIDTDINNNRLICFKSENHHYGTGFIVSNKWKNNIYRYWNLSDRISIIQLKCRESPKIPRYTSRKRRGKKVSNSN